MYYHTLLLWFAALLYMELKCRIIVVVKSIIILIFMLFFIYVIDVSDLSFASPICRLFLI